MMSSAAQEYNDADDLHGSTLLRSVVTELKKDPRADAERDRWRAPAPQPAANDAVVELMGQIRQKQADLEQENKEVLARLAMIADLNALYKAAQARLEELVSHRDTWISQIKELEDHVDRHRDL